MPFFKQLPRRIKYLEILSRLFLILFLFDFYFAQTCSYQYEFYIQGKNITGIALICLLFLPLLFAGTLEIISLLMQRKKGLLTKDALYSFAKFCLIIIVLAFFIGVFFINFCSRSGKAYDSRIISAIGQIRTVMSIIFVRDGSYDNFNCQHSEMIGLCRAVDNNCAKGTRTGFFVITKSGDYVEDGGEPIIVHDARENSQVACVYSPLNLGGWYCADSTGQVGETAIDPGSSGYCIEGESAVCPPFIED